MQITTSTVTAPSLSPASLSSAQAEPEATVAKKPDAAPETHKRGKSRAIGKSKEPNVPGVIRLLEAGHFKGVADVRLRINFHEQLSERATQNAAEQIGPGVETLVKTVGEETTALIESLAMDEPATAEVQKLAAEFEQTLRMEAEQAMVDGAISTEALGASFESAFSDFTAALRDLIAPEPTEPTEPAEQKPADDAALAADAAPAADETVPTEKEAASALSEPLEPAKADDPLAAMIGAFQTALSGLLDSIGQAQMLPEPSPPNGNGVAYARFLAIYNDLRGVGEPAELNVAG